MKTRREKMESHCKICLPCGRHQTQYLDDKIGSVLDPEDAKENEFVDATVRIVASVLNEL